MATVAALVRARRILAAGVPRPLPHCRERQVTGGPLWTVEEACQHFGAGPLPVEPWRLHRVIRALPGFTAAGRAPSAGPQGGRGKDMYPIGDLMRLHSKLAEWL